MLAEGIRLCYALGVNVMTHEGWTGGRRNKEKRTRALLRFLQEELVDAQKVVLRLDNLSNLGVLSVLNCLVAVPGVIRAGGQCPRRWESNKVVGKDMGCGLVDLHLPGTVPGELFTSSWPILGGTVPPGSAGPKMSNQQETQNKSHG